MWCYNCNWPIIQLKLNIECHFKIYKFYIGVCQKWQALFVAFLWEPSMAPFFVGERRVRVRGIQDSGDYGGDWRGYYEALHGAFKGE